MCSGGINCVFIAYTHVRGSSVPCLPVMAPALQRLLPLSLYVCVCPFSVLSWTTRQYSQRWSLSRCRQPICCRSTPAWSLTRWRTASWWTRLYTSWRSLPSWWEGWTSQVKTGYSPIISSTDVWYIGRYTVDVSYSFRGNVFAICLNTTKLLSVITVLY